MIQSSLTQRYLVVKLNHFTFSSTKWQPVWGAHLLRKSKAISLPDTDLQEAAKKIYKFLSLTEITGTYGNIIVVVHVWNSPWANFHHIHLSHKVIFLFFFFFMNWKLLFFFFSPVISHYIWFPKKETSKTKKCHIVLLLALRIHGLAHRNPWFKHLSL